MDKEELVNEFRELLDEVGFSYKVDDSTRPGAIVLSFGMKCGPGIGRVGAVFEFRDAGIRIYGVALELSEVKDLPELFKPELPVRRPYSRKLLRTENGFF